MLDEAGKLNNKIGIGVLDGGFYPGLNGDFPPGLRAISVVGATAAVNTAGPDPSATDHGTPVLNTVAAAADNNRGVIGTASPVADTIAVFTGYDLFHTVSALDQSRIAGASVANMSYGGWVPMGLEWSMLPFEASFLALHANGIQTIRCNSCNDGDGTEPRERATFSNFGTVPQAPDELGGWGESTVDIFAPYRTLSAPRPARPEGVYVVPGTSFASPYVAGVAALVWSANPSMSPGEVATRVHNSAQIPLDDEGNRDPEVKSIVDPIAAVSGVLDEVCPCVGIQNPTQGATTGTCLLTAALCSMWGPVRRCWMFLCTPIPASALFTTSRQGFRTASTQSARIPWRSRSSVQKSVEPTERFLWASPLARHAVATVSRSGRFCLEHAYS